MKKEKQFPKTLVDAIKYFADQQVAHDFVVSMRWPKGVKCPRCGSRRVSFTANRKVWTCNGRCPKRQQFSVKVGTIMEDSPIGIDKWLVAMWLILSAKNGISSYELGKAVGVTQKTAWFLNHRIRFALHSGSIEKMSGICEADESYIGAKARYMHKDKRTGVGHAGLRKTAVQGILERGTGEKHSRVVLKVVPNTRRPELCGNVREHIEKGSTVCTDALMSYDDLERDYDRRVIDHAESYAHGHVHTNCLENFWSLLKRALKGPYVNVEPFHLFRYLDEQAFRFNERKLTDSERFLAAVPSIVGRRLTYRGLTGNMELAAT
ncbi:MAG: IS1595 family transposase [Acidobacteria bacterium]|nr:MAG: IS1595 family transposase [Acidobacteriota bacterium]